jgi:hypothetical protein
MNNERYELPPQEEIRELVRRARTVTTSAGEPDTVEFLAAAAILLADDTMHGLSVVGQKALAIAVLAKAAADLKRRATESAA